ncbi:MAG: hypothetical protein R6U13_12980 [Desulfatiglandaceae bacterium]
MGEDKTRLKSLHFVLTRALAATILPIALYIELPPIEWNRIRRGGKKDSPAFSAGVFAGIHPSQ